MDIALLISRVLLALVFALSGAGKLADVSGSRRAVAGFGVSKQLANQIGIALPFAELALAAALLPALTVWWAAIGSLLLLLAFTVGMGVSLARGEQPDCHCFGAIHSEPVSRRTVGRNVMLSAVATLVVVGGRTDPGLGLFDWLGDADPVYAATVGAGVALLVAAGVGAIVIMMLYHRLAAATDHLQNTSASTIVPDEAEEVDAVLSVPVGTPAPPFEATALNGDHFVFEKALHQDRQLLLVFVNPVCTACERILPRLARWQQQVDDQISVIVISHGGDAENRAKAERTKFLEERYLLQAGYEVSQAFGVERVPVALHIASDGTLMSPAAGGVEAIAGLLDQITVEVDGNQPQRSNLVLKRIRTPFGEGDALPQLTLRENGIDPVSMPVPGRRTLIIFWSPACPFCERLLHQLRQWERSLPDDLTLAVLVRHGDVEATRAQGLEAMVVEDDGTARAHYEVTGTPVAVLTNPDGTLAKPMAIGLGASQVLAWDAITRASDVMVAPLETA